MDFNHDEEQLALRDAVRGLVSKAYGDYEQRRRAVATEPGFDEDLWRRLAEMGVLGLPFTEEDGGTGAGPVEVGLVAEELGRVLAPEPFLTSVVLAGGVVAAAGSPEQRAEVLGAVAAGEVLLAFAHTEPGSRWAPSASAVTASRGDGWTLTGTKASVPHGARADLLVVSAAVEGGTGLFLVDPGAGGVTRTAARAVDGSRSARIDLADAPATPLGDGGDATDLVARALDLARVAAGSQAVGTMSSALRTTSGYLTSRKQFGVTLNNFQALTFRASDMYVELELARSTVAWATMLAAEKPEDLHEAATRAGLQVSRASRAIGQGAIQLHGGIGMTAEYSIGAHTAHLAVLEHLLGNADLHLAELAARVGAHGEVDPLR